MTADLELFLRNVGRWRHVCVERYDPIRHAMVCWCGKWRFL